MKRRQKYRDQPKVTTIECVVCHSKFQGAPLRRSIEPGQTEYCETCRENVKRDREKLLEDKITKVLRENEEAMEKSSKNPVKVGRFSRGYDRPTHKIHYAKRTNAPF